MFSQVWFSDFFSIQDQTYSYLYHAVNPMKFDDYICSFVFMAETSFHTRISRKHGEYHLCFNGASQLHSLCCFLWASGTDNLSLLTPWY